MDRINGHELQITHLGTRRVSIVGIYWTPATPVHLEALVLARAPGALHFQQSLQILDEQEKGICNNVDDNGDRSTRAPDVRREWSTRKERAQRERVNARGRDWWAVDDRRCSLDRS